MSAPRILTLECSGYSATVTNFGARLLELRDPAGDNWVLTPPADLLLSDPNYLGATAGRVCNRIRNGRLPCGGVIYQLSLNEGAHHLHGGETGFDRRWWDVVTEPDRNSPCARFRLLSPAGEEGYPGTIEVTADFHLHGHGALTIRYESTVLSGMTHINLTPHAYWTLSGEMDDYVLQSHSSAYLMTDDHLVPTGAIRATSGSDTDFSQPRKLGRQEIDRYFIVPAPSAYLPLVEISHPPSGRHLAVFSDQPGFQLYTGHLLEKPFRPFSGFCVEPSGYIDAANHPSFPSTLRREGESCVQATTFVCGMTND